LVGGDMPDMTLRFLFHTRQNARDYKKNLIPEVNWKIVKVRIVEEK